MLTTFIDALPQKMSERDGRIHASFNQLGTDTGRFSCTEPNLQQIPSHQKDIRMMFKASEKEIYVELNGKCYSVGRDDDVCVDNDVWKPVQNLKVGDRILNSYGGYDIITEIVESGDKVQIFV